MPILSSVINWFATPFENSVTMTLSGTIAPGATTVGVTGMTNYTNNQVVVFAVDAGGASKQVFTGTVSGANVVNVVWTYGTNVTHTDGAPVIDYVSSTTVGMISAGIQKQHAQTGAHVGITNTGGATFDGLTSTGANIFNGSWDGWVGANESWTYASASTITVPTNATTKYDIGDSLKITQSATVKYFIITGVAATVLTVSGLTGATVANSAITANAYSKVYSPHGDGITGVPYNATKFSVYRHAAWTTPNNSSTIVAFDTKDYDTGSNVDIVTNKGRFTAPIAGFYRFDTTVSAGASTRLLIDLEKNGVEFKRLYDTGSTAVTAPTGGGGDTLQLAANDYVEVGIFTSANVAGETDVCTHFSGFLVSAL